MAMLEMPTHIEAQQKPTQFQTLTIVSIVLALISATWGILDPRMVDGAFVWMKPLKFSLSFALLFATLAIVENIMSAPLREGWVMRITGWVMATAFLAEMGYMIFQGAQAEASHFNMSTPFNEFMYTVVMAAGAVALVACVGVIGWLVKRDRKADISEPLRESIWLGFALSFVLTMIVAGYLSSAGGHHVGIHPEGAPTLPLMDWSGVTGDLRPAHFFSLHAMQVLPLLALWVERRDIGNPVMIIRLAAFGYAGLTLAVFAIALAGMPLIPLG
ncbi:MAG: hypothetical protein AAF940_03935 [Pseudomonadota bacterium]